MVANAPRQPERSGDTDRGRRPPGSPQRARIRVHALVAIFVWGLVVALVLRFFAPIAMVGMGFLAAVAVAALLRPIVRALPGPRGRRATLVGIAFILTAIAAIIITGRLIARPIRQQFQNWPQINQDLNSVLQRFSAQVGIDQPLTVETLTQQAAEFFSGGGTQVVSITTNIISETMIVLAFILVGSLYLLITPPGRLSNPLVDMLPLRRRASANAMLDDLEVKLRWWLIGTMISMVAVGVLSWLGFQLVGLRFATALAILMAFAEIIPTLGPAVAFLIALLIALSQGTTQVIGVISVWCVIQLVESYVLLPLIMKRAVKIPPVVTLFTVVLWGKILGVGGLLLAIPIDLVIWSAADHFLRRHPAQDESTTKQPKPRLRQRANDAAKTPEKKSSSVTGG